MPVEYSGIVAEHMATRTAAGLFDVSHMGEIEVRGPHALELVQHVTCNDASKLVVGQAQYSGLMTAQRHVRRRPARAQDFRHALFSVRQREQSGSGLRAHPRAQRASARKSKMPAHATARSRFRDRKRWAFCNASRPCRWNPSSYYHFAFGKVDGVDCLIARTGYTGEDGFEIYFAPEHSEKLWGMLLDAGSGQGLLPCGLGARNTLRLEASMCLYGHEIDDYDHAVGSGPGLDLQTGQGRIPRARCARSSQKEKGIDRALVRIRNAGSAYRARRLLGFHRQRAGRPA